MCSSSVGEQDLAVELGINCVESFRSPLGDRHIPVGLSAEGVARSRRLKIDDLAIAAQDLDREPFETAELMEAFFERGHGMRVLLPRVTIDKCRQRTGQTRQLFYHIPVA